MRLRKVFTVVSATVLLCVADCLSVKGSSKPPCLHQIPGFVGVCGPDLISPEGERLFIVGTNLGNWLNPEGYMFGFRRTNSPRKIDELFRELVGPDATDAFWEDFRKNYITRADIDYIASTGANTIRMPFHYKLFTDEPYMGLNNPDKGFEMIDSVIGWCKANNLYLILDMHDAPGGQTGDNIDDSYGYPWLFRSAKAQEQFLGIWRKIAQRYANEPVILGYELINEPIAHYFEDKEELNAMLEPLHKRAVSAIREVDGNHIILLGGPQWNSNFDPFTDFDYDPLLMYTCHRYGGEASREAIGSFIDFRDRSGRPMYMGEIGHNTDKWQSDFVEVLKGANIGYTFWSYKKLKDSCMAGVKEPEGWQTVVDFSEGPHATYEEIRKAVPDREKAQKALDKYIENIRFENCVSNDSYIRSMGLIP